MRALMFAAAVLGACASTPAREARIHYTAALKLNPDSAVTHNNLARIFHTQGRLDAAIEHYNAALEIDPKLALAHNNLGILLIQKGDQQVH